MLRKTDGKEYKFLFFLILLAAVVFLMVWLIFFRHEIYYPQEKKTLTNDQIEAGIERLKKNHNILE